MCHTADIWIFSLEHLSGTCMTCCNCQETTLHVFGLEAIIFFIRSSMKPTVRVITQSALRRNGLWCCWPGILRAQSSFFSTCSLQFSSESHMPILGSECQISVFVDTNFRGKLSISALFCDAFESSIVIFLTHLAFKKLFFPVKPR